MSDPHPSLFEHETATKRNGPVECFGMTFESDEARRAHFLDRLREELPELRKRPDFPVAEDEDILRLSDPPYYTACPNPFLAEFVERHGQPYDATVPYHREPFAVDVSEGKTDQLYRAHGYHTKVPHLAIVPSILHYTKPGDIVLDGFCGWQDRDYATIIAVARKIPEQVLQEDPKLLMWFDQALTRSGEDA